MSGGKKSSVVGHRYFFGIHMGIGRGPVDALHEVKVGDRTAWVGNVSANTTLNLDSPNLFGGEDKEGGIQGPLELMFGEPTQTPSPGLAAMLGTPLSGFRRMFTVFFNGLVSMNNPYPKPWAFRFSRILKGWDGEVFQPSLAAVPMQELTTSFTTPILDLPLTAPGVANGGAGTIDAPWLFPSILYDSDGMTLSNMNEEMDQPVVALGTNWSYGPGLTGFNQVEHQIELTSHNINLNLPTHNFRVAMGVIEYTLLPGGSGGQADNYVVEYTIQDDIPQFRLLVTRPFGPMHVIPLGNPASIKFRVVHDNAGRESRYFINGGLVLVRAYPEFGGVTSGLNFQTIGVGAPFYNIDTSPWFAIAKFRNWRLIGYKFDQLAAMNPAHIIFECLTNREWGRGLPRSKIDSTSFTQAAQQLFDEGFGLCMKWTRKESISAFIQVVLNHIAGSLYQSRQTGLMTLKLIRGDYDINSMPVYTTENGLLEVKPSGVGSASSSVNAITVKWHDPINDEDRTVSVKNTAAIVRNGGAVNSTTNDYTGIPNAGLALRVAQRDLRAASTNLRRFTVVADRTLDHLHPGEVFVLRDDSRGVPTMAVRIGRANYGTLVSGKVTFEVVQDVFTLPSASFVAEVPNTHTPPDTTPCVDEQTAFEAPYFLLAGRMSPADFAYVKEDGGYFVAVASKGKPINVGVQMAVRQSAPTPEDNPADDSFVCGI